MNSPQKIIIGTRGSELALKQADIVATALKVKAAETGSTLTIEVRTIVTYGDTNQSPIPLDTIGKSWFTKEIENELRAGTIDIAVHSLKDLAMEDPEGLTLAAYLPREDARDALITRRGEPLEKLHRGAIVGTDSPRRQSQMLAMRPDLTMKSLRGNVPTRIKKLEGTFEGKNGSAGSDENYDAIILAIAGLKRLGLEGKAVRYFEPDEMTPAPGQGILAVQARSDDTAVQEILAHINDADVAHIAEIERSFARATGAGCKSPVGAYAYREKSGDGSADVCHLIAMVAREDGTNIIRGTAQAPWGASTSLGEKLAKKLLGKLNE